MSIALTLYVREADGLAAWAQCARSLAAGHGDTGLQVVEGQLEEARKALLAQALRFPADACLRFELDASRDVPAQLQLTLDTTLRSLEQQPGDAALVFNGEMIYLVRREGVLLLNDQRGLWNAERVALIRGPYQRQCFPVI